MYIKVSTNYMQVYSKYKMSQCIAIFSKDALPYKLLKADSLYFMTPWVKYNTCLVCYIYNNKKPQLLKCMNGNIGLPKNRICLPPLVCQALGTVHKRYCTYFRIFDTSLSQVWFLLCCFWNFRLRNAVSQAIVWRRRYRIEFFIWLKLRFCKDASKFLKNHHFKFVTCSPVKSTVEILQMFLENMNSNTSNLPQIY